jgi:hypothetical protein
MTADLLGISSLKLDPSLFPAKKTGELKLALPSSFGSDTVSISSAGRGLGAEGLPDLYDTPVEEPPPAGEDQSGAVGGVQGAAMPGEGNIKLEWIMRQLEKCKAKVEEKISSNLEEQKEDEKIELKKKLKQKLAELIERVKKMDSRLGTAQLDAAVQVALQPVLQKLAALEAAIDGGGGQDAEEIIGGIVDVLREAELASQVKVREDQFTFSAGGQESREIFRQALDKARHGGLSLKDFNSMLKEHGQPEFTEEAWDALMGGVNHSFWDKDVVVGEKEFLAGVKRIWQTIRGDLGDNTSLNDMREDGRAIPKYQERFRSLAREERFVLVPISQVAQLSREIVRGRAKTDPVVARNLWKYLGEKFDNKTIEEAQKSIDDWVSSHSEKWEELAVYLLSQVRHNFIHVETGPHDYDAEKKKQDVFERIMKAVGEGQGHTNFRKQIGNLFFMPNGENTGIFDHQAFFAEIDGKRPSAKAQPQVAGEKPRALTGKEE